MKENDVVTDHVDLINQLELLFPNISYIASAKRNLRLGTSGKDSISLSSRAELKGTVRLPLELTYHRKKRQSCSNLRKM
jgi:hypothetical protein